MGEDYTEQTALVLYYPLSKNVFSNVQPELQVSHSPCYSASHYFFAAFDETCELIRLGMSSYLGK